MASDGNPARTADVGSLIGALSMFSILVFLIINVFYTHSGITGLHNMMIQTNQTLTTNVQLMSKSLTVNVQSLSQTLTTNVQSLNAKLEQAPKVVQRDMQQLVQRLHSDSELQQRQQRDIQQLVQRLHSDSELEQRQHRDIQQLVQHVQLELQNGCSLRVRCPEWLKATHIYLTDAVVAMGRWDWDRVFCRTVAIATIAFLAFVVYERKKTAKKDGKPPARASA